MATDTEYLNRRYTVVLNEAQRQYIQTALYQCQTQGYYGADRQGRKEIDSLVNMVDIIIVQPTINDFTITDR